MRRVHRGPPEDDGSQGRWVGATAAGGPSQEPATTAQAYSPVRPARRALPRYRRGLDPDRWHQRADGASGGLRSRSRYDALEDGTPFLFLAGVGSPQPNYGGQGHPARDQEGPEPRHHRPAARRSELAPQ